MSKFFVGGSPRSGTTLLHLLLCRDNETNKPTLESGYFRILFHAYSQAKQEFDRHTKHYFDDRRDLWNFHRSIISLFLKRTAKRFPDSRHLVFKETNFSKYFPDILELIPDSYFFLTVRDPRDAVASMIRVGERHKQKGEYLGFQESNIRTLCNHYRSFYIAPVSCKAKFFKDRLFVSKYEELVTEPDRVLDRLRRFSGLELKIDSSRDLDDGGFDARSNYGLWATELFGKKISSERIGKYRDVLTDDDVKEINRNCEDIYRIFGYS